MYKTSAYNPRDFEALSLFMKLQERSRTTGVLRALKGARRLQDMSFRQVMLLKLKLLGS